MISMSERLHWQVDEKLHIYQKQTLKGGSSIKSKAMFLIFKMRQNVYSIFKNFWGNTPDSRLESNANNTEPQIIP